MSPSRRQSPIYLITGLIIGLLVGLFYSWVYSPVGVLETELYTLRSDFKDDYRGLIASAYLANSDLGRAQSRLDLLQDEDSIRALTVQAQRELGQEGSDLIARALGILAADIGNGFSGNPEISPSNTPIPTETQISAPTITQTAGPSKTPTLTLTPLASRTPTPTVGAAFILRDYTLVCESAYQETSLIMVRVFNSANQPVPGEKIVASWDQGQDSFFTGLKIEFGLGYADFEMSPDTSYTIRIADGGESLPGLSPLECENDDGDRWLGSWSVNFTQP